MEAKRLYRSNTEKKVFGVCGGIAEYFNVDPTLIRLGVVAIALMFGTGLLAYLIAAFVMPVKPAE